MELNGKHEWEKHIKTRKHWSCVNKQNKLARGLDDKEYYKNKNIPKIKTKVDQNEDVF
jgi:hypothetical protein